MVVIRALESLTVSEDLREKVIGKQKLYFANQDKLAGINEQELKEWDEKIAERRATLKTVLAAVKEKEQELQMTGSAQTIEQLQLNIAETSALIEAQKGRIAAVADPGCPRVKPEDKEKALREKEEYTQQWRKRKRMVANVLNAILEHYPKSKQDLMEDIGLETDEENNVSLPQ